MCPHNARCLLSGEALIPEMYRDIIAKCEVSRYASVEGEVDADQVDEVVNLIRSIEKKSKK